MQTGYKLKGIPCDSNHDTTIKKRLSFIEENLQINNDQFFLDIGVGFGAYLKKIYSEVGQYIGIDVVEENLKIIKKDCHIDNVHLIKNAAEFLPFDNCTFNNVIMIEVLEHVNDDKKTIREIFRVLKPGGNLIITAPNKFFPFETHGFRMGSRNIATKGLGFPLVPYLPNCLRKYCCNANVYSPKTLKKMLKEEGFSIQKISYLCPGLDQLKNNFPEYPSHITFIQKKIDSLERLSPLNIFLTTIIIHATKKYPS